MNSAKQAGFTLVEVLIASAIVAASMGVILQLFGAGLDRMHRAGGAEKMILVKRQIFDDIRMSNPAVEASRAGEVEGVSYQWVASPYGVSHALVSGYSGYTKVQMYKVAVRFSEAENESFEVMQMGYKYVSK